MGHRAIIIACTATKLSHPAAAGKLYTGIVWSEWRKHATLGVVRQAVAKQFVRDHHQHAPKPPAGWRWGHAVYNGDELIGVAMVGRPVARRIDHTTTVEINRLCVDIDAPALLRWNACSMLYGAAVREAKRRGYRLVITYTLDDEAATSLRAAGFKAVAVTKGGSWTRPSRRRQDSAPTCRKTRWERTAA